MYIFNKLMTPFTTTSTIYFLPRLEKTWKFNYRRKFKISKFHFLDNFVSSPRISHIGSWQQESVIRLVVAHSLRNKSSTSNAGNRRGVKADVRQQVSSHGMKKFPLEELSIADLEYALNHLSKWLLMILLGAVLICKHDNEALWIASGSLVNASISSMLKKIIIQDRPIFTSRLDPGMPSSHAQTIFFTSIFAILSLFQCQGSNAFTISISSLTLAFSSYLSSLRVSQKFHTPSQVAVGAVLGTAVSILWFWSWVAIVQEAFISNLWVRVIVDAGAVAFWIGFLKYISRHLNIPEDHNM